MTSPADESETTLQVSTGTKLRLRDLDRMREPVRIRIDSTVRHRIQVCRDFMLGSLDRGRSVYGATTGFGPLVGFRGRETTAEQCENALNHLIAGQGADLESSVVRAAMLVRLHSLCQGRSGASLAVVEGLAHALGTDFAPAVPRLGSLGASGDLIPLAYVARALQGHGHAYTGGERLTAGEALAKLGLKPVELDGRDALALVNGTSLTAGAGALAVSSLQRSLRGAVLLVALLVDILGCSTAFVDARLLAAFGHPHAALAGERLNQLLKGLVPSGTRGLQEPYSIRCAPQLIGAAASLVEHCAGVMCDDINAISDNPLFFPEQDVVAHGGNFFGQPAAFSGDALAVTAVQLGNLAERQLDLLIDPHRNGGLPPMLAPEPGRQHAVQGVQLAATALIASMRRAAIPASTQSLPTNLHNQDVIPFGTQAALNALDLATKLRLLHGSLAVALRQAACVGTRQPTAPLCTEVLGKISAEIPPIDRDRPLDADVRRAAALLDDMTDTYLTEGQGL
ncbi:MULTISPECIES: aromatic amino acid ammonia-lyase [unclassified Streptomyces]|uniref:aromatic amino acid ammonia-lyase n=1 Tax=unclassified Streptomyces TaxID=2593676 RepID=UPI0027DBB7C7|nr:MULTISPECIES: aromatic amino acid ammonia-lyase [unclassified Streptomyces]